VVPVSSNRYLLHSAIFRTSARWWRKNSAVSLRPRMDCAYEQCVWAVRMGCAYERCCCRNAAKRWPLRPVRGGGPVCP